MGYSPLLSLLLNQPPPADTDPEEEDNGLVPFAAPQRTGDTDSGLGGVVPGSAPDIIDKIRQLSPYQPSPEFNPRSLIVPGAMMAAPLLGAAAANPLTALNGLIGALGAGSTAKRVADVFDPNAEHMGDYVEGSPKHDEMLAKGWTPDQMAKRLEEMITNENMNLVMGMTGDVAGPHEGAPLMPQGKPPRSAAQREASSKFLDADKPWPTDADIPPGTRPINEALEYTPLEPKPIKIASGDPNGKLAWDDNGNPITVDEWIKTHRGTATTEGYYWREVKRLSDEARSRDPNASIFVYPEYPPEGYEYWRGQPGQPPEYRAPAPGKTAYTSKPTPPAGEALPVPPESVVEPPAADGSGAVPPRKPPARNGGGNTDEPLGLPGGLPPESELPPGRASGAGVYEPSMFDEKVGATGGNGPDMRSATMRPEGDLSLQPQGTMPPLTPEAVAANDSLFANSLQPLSPTERLAVAKALDQRVKQAADARARDESDLQLRMQINEIRRQLGLPAIPKDTPITGNLAEQFPSMRDSGGQPRLIPDAPISGHEGNGPTPEPNPVRPQETIGTREQATTIPMRETDDVLGPEWGIDEGYHRADTRQAYLDAANAWESNPARFGETPESAADQIAIWRKAASDLAPNNGPLPSKSFTPAEVVRNADEARARLNTPERVQHELSSSEMADFNAQNKTRESLKQKPLTIDEYRANSAKSIGEAPSDEVNVFTPNTQGSFFKGAGENMKIAGNSTPNPARALADLGVKTLQRTLADPMNAVSDFFRPILATFDLSFLGSATSLAGSAIAHPIATARAAGSAKTAMWDTLKAATNPEGKPAITSIVDVIRQEGPTGARNLADAAHDGIIISAAPDAVKSEFGGSILTKVPAVGRVFKAADAGFNTFGDVLRYEFYKSMVVNRRNALEQVGKTMPQSERNALAEVINNMTGTSNDSISPIEKLAFFAPRFFRAQLKFYGAAIKGEGAAASEARWMLAQTIGGAVVVTYIANKARGYDTVFDPSDPNFMRIRDVMGQDVSLLNQYDVAFKTGGALGSNLKKNAALNPDSPLDAAGRVGQSSLETAISFGRQKSSPVVSMATDLLSREDFSGESYKKPFTDFVLQFAKNHSIPMSASTALEGWDRAGGGKIIGPIVKKLNSNEPLTDEDITALKHATGNSIAALMIGGLGLHSSPLSSTDIRDQIVKDRKIEVLDGNGGRRIAQNYADLNAKQKNQFNNDPEVKKAIENIPTKDGLSEWIKEQKQKHYGEQQTADDEFRAIQKSTKDQPGAAAREWQNVRKDRYAKLDEDNQLQMKDPEYRDRLENLKKNPQTPVDKALSEYYSIGEKYPVAPGKKRPDEYYAESDQFMAKLPEGIRSSVEESLGIQRTPLEDEYYSDIKKLAPFYTLAAKVKADPAFKRVFDKVEQNNGSTTALTPSEKTTYTFAEKKINDIEKAWKAQNPKLEAIGMKWLGWEKPKASGNGITIGGIR